MASEIVPGQGMVLLVDDEEMIRHVGEELLQAIGYDVITAASGEEAVTRLKEAPEAVDVVILDLIMPGMSGNEFFEGIRALDPGVRTLLSSGYGLNSQAREILDSGCSGFIQKPFDLRELSRKVRDLLEDRSKPGLEPPFPRAGLGN